MSNDPMSSPYEGGPVFGESRARVAGFRVRADDGTWCVSVRHRRPTAERPGAVVDVHVATRLPDVGAVDVHCVSFETAAAQPAMDLCVTLAGGRLGVGAGADMTLDVALRLALAAVLPRLARLAPDSAVCGGLYARLGALPVKVGALGLSEASGGPVTIRAAWRAGRAETLEVTT